MIKWFLNMRPCVVQTLHSTHNHNTTECLCHQPLLVWENSATPGSLAHTILQMLHWNCAGFAFCLVWEWNISAAKTVRQLLSCTCTQLSQLTQAKLVAVHPKPSIRSVTSICTVSQISMNYSHWHHTLSMYWIRFSSLAHLFVVSDWNKMIICFLCGF